MNKTLISTATIAVILLVVLSSYSDAFGPPPSGSSRQNSCRQLLDNCKNGISKLKCNCNLSSCWRSQDCCFNIFDESGPEAHESLVNERRLYDCHLFTTLVGLPNMKIKPKTEKGYSLVSRCNISGSYDSENSNWTKNQCEMTEYKNGSDPFLRVPVTSKITGESYKNIYCAACHSDASHVVFWNVDTICTDSSSLNETEAMQEALQNWNVESSESTVIPECELKIYPPKNVATTRCFPAFNPTCPSNYVAMVTSPEDLKKRQQIDWLCRITRLGIRLWYNTTYNNFYCAACHLNRTDIELVVNSTVDDCLLLQDSFCEPRCLPSEYLKKSTKSFAVIFDVDFSSSKGNAIGLLEKCPVGEIYDAFSSRCRTIFCSESYYYLNGECHLNETLPPTAARVLKCPKLRLEKFEGVIDENGTLTVNNQRRYATGSYERDDNGTIYVCINISDNYLYNFNDDANLYTTIFCNSISIIALLLKIMTFVLIPEIRNFPAKLVVCLSVSLLLAQLLFMATLSLVTNYPVCATIGVLLHYFFLSSFGWMNILAYDLWHTFSHDTESRTLLHSKGLQKRFYCYSCYAWLMPLFIVFVACLFDWGGIVNEYSVLRPVYGVLAVCWISTKTALLLYFVGPLGFLLVSNIAFFFLTAAKIYATSKATMAVQTKAIAQKQVQCSGTVSEVRSCGAQSPHHLRLSLYVKLALIMGLTWVSGFVAAYAGQSFLWYFFIAINASQGVYILLAFTPYRKVQQFVQRQFKPKKAGYAGKVGYGGFKFGNSSYRKLQRSSTRSSQTTTTSINYSIHGHPKAVIVVSNSG